MSGSPRTYSRGLAIAHLMQDSRRPVIKELQEKNKSRRVYLDDATDSLFVDYCDTIDWVPKLAKLTRYGREEMYICEGRPDEDGKPYIQWGTMEIKPVDGWPTEEEIAICIAESTEREKNWNGSLSDNDLTAFNELNGNSESI